MIVRRKQSDLSANQPAICLGVYYLVVGLFLIGLTAPEGRVWGVNWWAYLPTTWQYLLIGISLAAGPALWSLFGYLHRRQNETKAEVAQTSYYYSAIPFVLLSTTLFILFPSSTHFLGDGYQLLSRLTDGLGSVKSWDVGASLLNDALFGLISGSPGERALATYRIISVASGVLTLASAFVAAMVLFKETVRRILFLIGIATGGYALMFFGYVENYGLLIAMLILYSLVGLVVLRGRISPWWALPPMMAASFIHIFGLTLLPSFIYLLLRQTRLIARMMQLSYRTKLIIGGAAFLGALAVYHYLNTTYRFFTFAFLPILPDQFTVEADYLLSPKHLIDTLNLLLLLVPGLLVLTVGITLTSGRKFFERLESRFLLVLTLSTLAAVYAFNPGIGMPRNWDLFSIVGVPLAVMCYYSLLSSRTTGMVPILAASLACMLSLLTLGPRVAAQATPQVAISHFKNYLKLDRIRNRNARRLLIDYYKLVGDAPAAAREQNLAEQDFPDSRYNKLGKQHLGSDRIDQAETAFVAAIDINPLFYDAYANLATCFIHRGRLDSALVLLEIADGLNPYNARTVSNIGTVYMRNDEIENAVSAFNESLRIDSMNQNAVAGLASCYLKLDQPDRSGLYVKKLYDRKEMAPQYFLQAAGAYLDAGYTNHARQAWQYAVSRGLSAEEIRSMTSRYPQLLE